MRYYLTKASDDDWYDIMEIQDETLYELYDKIGRFIVKQNYWYRDSVEDICRYRRVPKEDAKKISQARIEIIIYDSYIE